jgi:hypothetical protein
MLIPNRNQSFIFLHPEHNYTFSRQFIKQAVCQTIPKIQYVDCQQVKRLIQAETSGAAFFMEIISDPGIKKFSP